MINRVYSRFSITQKIAGLLVATVCGAVITGIFSYTYFAQTSADISAVNVAGRQRMLSRVLYEYATMVHNGQDEDIKNLKIFVTEFDKALVALELGGTVLGRKLSPAPPDVLDEIRSTKQQWREIKAALLTIANKPADDPESAEAYQFVSLSIGQLTEAADHVTSVFELRNMNLRAKFLAVIVLTIIFDFIFLIVGIWMIRRYLTDRRTAEKVLRLTQFSVDNSTDAVYWIGPDAKFIYVNNAAIKTLGYSKEELLAMTVHDIGPEFPAEVWPAHWAEMKERKSFVIHTIHQRKDNSIFPVEITTNLIRFGGREINCAIAKDITERKQAEEALRESEEKFRTLVEYINIIPWRFDLKMNRFTFIGKQVERVLGYPVESWTDLNSWSNRIHPDDRHTAVEFCMISTEKGRDHEMEYRCATSKGEIVWLRDIITVRKDEKGIPFELIGYMIDITPRKLAEEALIESEIRYQEVIDSVLEGICLTDENEIILFCNPAFATIFGEDSPDSTIGKNFLDYLSKDQIKKVLAETEKRKKGESSQYELKITTSKGEKKTILTWVTPKFDGERNFVSSLCAITDITEHKQAEEALEESEKKYRALSELSPVGVFSTDTEGNCLYVNEAWCTFAGLSSEEAKGKGWINAIHPEDRDRVIEEWSDALKSDREFQSEYRFRTPSGKITWLDGRAKSHKDKHGNVAGYLGTVSDITETKRLREQESRAERLEMAGTIAGQVAHDFNNLLAPILAYPEFIHDELPHDHEAHAFLDAIEDAAKKIANINQDLLTMGRRGHYTKDVINLNRIVLRAIQGVESRPSTVTYKTDLCESLMSIKGGDAQIHRMLINLMVNAQDAIEGVGQITIKTENYYVDDTSLAFSRVPRGEYVKLTVSDNGCGIPDNIIEKIIDPFFTTKTADRKRGSGLGLSVVDAVVKDHNGYLDLSSKVGHGTLFYIYFPVTREDAEKDESEYMAGGTETILIVDDDEVQREVVLRLLKKLGYQVTTVESGEKAIEFLRENPQDLVILDMVMPGGIDGAETYRQILDINPHQKAIILSGFSESDRVLEAQKLGAGVFVRKPVTKSIIAAAVRTELDRQVVVVTS